MKQTCLQDNLIIAVIEEKQGLTSFLNKNLERCSKLFAQMYTVYLVFD